jgi:WD40 repeat protein
MDAVVRVWDRQTGREIAVHQGHTAWPACLAFSPDGRLLASAGADQRLVVWEVDGWRERASFKGSSDTLTTLAFAPDGRTIATGGADGVVRVWPADPPQLPATNQVLSDGSPDPMLAPDGRGIAVQLSSRVLQLWEAPRFRERARLDSPRSNIVSFALGPGGHRVAVGTDSGWVLVAEVAPEGGGVTWQEFGQHAGEIMQVTFSGDGRALASVGRNDEIRIWDVASRRTTAVIPEKLVHFSRPCGLSTDGSRLAVVAGLAKVHLYETAGSRRIADLPLEGPYWDDPVFTPDGRRLVTMTEDGRLQLWEVATGRQEVSLRGQLLHVHFAGFSPDGRRMATGTGEGTVKVWDLASMQEVATLRPGGDFRPVLMVQFTPDGRSLVALKHNQVFAWGSADPEREP